MTLEDRLLDHLTFLYGAERAPSLLKRLQAILDGFRRRNPHLPTASVHPSHRQELSPGLSEKNVILITYGDQIREPGTPPLQTLAEVLTESIGGVITGIHLLPFFPYSSDDGFSVTDYRTVNPDLGTWADIERLGQSFQLMFDAVINHISAHSHWFQSFLNGDPKFEDHFIVVAKGTDLSQVVRPRALPLLTWVQTPAGERAVWTTFSSDQIDLNYANPDVLLYIIDLLLFYVERGARLIRLDAIAYLWKEIGTPCIHLERTHRVVKLFRVVLDAVAPHTILITETNVPHTENISYFGDGTDEAQMVYQFPLPPLVLHTFHTGDASHLSRWAAGLETPSESTTFFNFLASHDGIGMRPVEGILTGQEIQDLVERTLAHGGYVSYKAEADGSQSIYELNISYFDALSSPAVAEPLDLQADRFLASQAIMLSLAGVPGVYFHSLFGSRSHHAGARNTGHHRAINREKLRRADLERDLDDPDSLRHRVFRAYRHLIRTRTAHQAFHPNGPQEILSLHPALFTLVRHAPHGSEALLCIHNVSNAEQSLHLDVGPLPLQHSGQLRDLVAGLTFPVDGSGGVTLRLAPYQVLWLSGDTR